MYSDAGLGMHSDAIVDRAMDEGTNAVVAPSAVDTAVETVVLVLLSAGFVVIAFVVAAVVAAAAAVDAYVVAEI